MRSHIVVTYRMEMFAFIMPANSIHISVLVAIVVCIVYLWEIYSYSTPQLKKNIYKKLSRWRESVAAEIRRTNKEKQASDAMD